jgi:hypothetical protein
LKIFDVIALPEIAAEEDWDEGPEGTDRRLRDQRPQDHRPQDHRPEDQRVAGHG